MDPGPCFVYVREVRIGKNCDQGLEGSIFKPEVTVNATLSLNWLYRLSTNHSQKKNSERTSEYLLDKERCLKEQIYFELLYVSCI